MSGRSAAVLITTLAAICTGCSEYRGVVRPTPQLSVLSPELENLTDAAIDIYLKAQVRPAFPTTMAIARIASPYAASGPWYGDQTPELDPVRGDEADGWRRMEALKDAEGRSLIEQVQFLNKLLISEKMTLKTLRDGAALLHAPLLLVYLQVDRAAEGQNEAAMAYWSIVGLFTVPGNTVGHHTVCQGIILDTRSGFVLATVEGESKHEERVLPGAVEIARNRTAVEAQAEATRKLQTNSSETLRQLAAMSQPRPGN